VAIALTQSLDFLGLIDLKRSIYLSSGFDWAGAILGGLCFGFGMALVGTCGYGSLVRLGGGDLKALIVMLVLAVAAYMTLHGPLAMPRVFLAAATRMDLPLLGSQGIPAVLAYHLGLSERMMQPIFATLSVAALLTFCFRDSRFRAAHLMVFGGVATGLLIAAGWATTGILGADEFEPAKLQSLTFVTPVGDSLMYIMTSSGSHLDFGIASVFGVVLGASSVSLLKGEFTVESFDSERQTLRHIFGAALMGFGGVTALGCTIGQGLSGMSTLSLSAPLALGAIVLGAALGLNLLLIGRRRRVTG